MDLGELVELIWLVSMLGLRSVLGLPMVLALCDLHEFTLAEVLVSKICRGHLMVSSCMCVYSLGTLGISIYVSFVSP